MTYFSGYWSVEIKRRISPPRQTLWLVVILSAAIHAAILFFYLPVTQARLPLESSWGSVSVQLVASTPKTISRPVPEKKSGGQPKPKETVREPVPEPEIRNEVTPPPVAVAAEAMPEPQEAVTEVLSEPSAAARPSTGSRSGNDQEIQFSVPAYSSNPKPEYPLAAQRAGSEGRVLLRVVVSETGDAVSLSVEKSSGYRILDLAAERAVMKWKFIPASRGRTNISSICVVPIRFNLQEGVKIE